MSKRENSYTFSSTSIHNIMIFFFFPLFSLDRSSERRRKPGGSDEVVSRGTAAEVGKLSPGECRMQQSQQLQLRHQGMRNTDQQ